MLNPMPPKSDTYSQNSSSVTPSDERINEFIIANLISVII